MSRSNEDWAFACAMFFFLFIGFTLGCAVQIHFVGFRWHDKKERVVRIQGKLYRVGEELEPTFKGKK